MHCIDVQIHSPLADEKPELISRELTNNTIHK